MSLWYLAAGFLQAQNNNLKQHSMIMNSISKLLKFSGCTTYLHLGNNIDFGKRI